MWDGVVSAVVGGLVSLLIALLVVNRTRASTADLAREQSSLEAARYLGVHIHVLQAELDEVWESPWTSAEGLWRSATKRFEVTLVEHLPSVADNDLRAAVERISNVMHNFAYFAGHSPDDWGEQFTETRTAYVQVADYISLTRDRLIEYRQGVLRGTQILPGWRRLRGEWLWRVPPGLNVDGSGRPNPEWEHAEGPADATGSYWRRTSHTA